MNHARLYRSHEEDARGGVVLRRRGDRVRVTRGLYVDASAVVDERLRAAAMLQLLPRGSSLSHHTAARYWGGVVPHSETIHVSVPEHIRRRRAGLSLHRRRRDPQVTLRHGSPVTTPLQTFLDMATHLGLVDLIVLGDSLVRRGCFTVGELVAYLEGESGRGSALARRAGMLVRAGVDSPMETRLRLLLVLAGYPEPEVNVIVRGAGGAWVHRMDLAWVSWRLAVEYDGRQHAESPAQWSTDIRRREAFANAGWRIVTAVSEDVYVRPAAFLDRLDIAISERGGRPPRRVAGWERYFPSR